MPTITFKSDNKTATCNQGDALIDICKRENTSIPFGCQNGICGTCIMKVTKGGENVSQMEDKERNTLAMFGAGPTNRLACQCKVNGDIEIEDL